MGVLQKTFYVLDEAPAKDTRSYARSLMERDMSFAMCIEVLNLLHMVFTYSELNRCLLVIEADAKKMYRGANL